MTLENIIPGEVQSDLIQLGFRMDRQEVDLENCHDLLSTELELSLVTDRQLAQSLAVTVNDDHKAVITASGDKVKLTIHNSKVYPELKNIRLQGRKKLIILQTIIKHGIKLNTWTDNGWVVYQVLWNNKPYNVGYMESNPNACFMSKVHKKEQKLSPKDYNKRWRQYTSKHQFTEMGNIELSHEVYGHSEASLGSIVTDSIEDELLEAYRVFERYRDTYVGKQLLDDLVSMA
jgi:hypothetical protein